MNKKSIPPLLNFLHRYNAGTEEARFEAALARKENARRIARQEYLDASKVIETWPLETRKAQYAIIREALEKKIGEINAS